MPPALSWTLRHALYIIASVAPCDQARRRPERPTVGGTVETNPLVSFREQLGLTPEELAGECGVGVEIIRLQEKGIPHHLHPSFLRKFPDTTELIPEYQAYRVSRRRRNFAKPKEIPTDGPGFARYLQDRRLSSTEFSELACMPAIDIRHALHHWRLPVTLVRFFEELDD